DEAAALAAGHRPCAECRRERFNALRKAWRSAHPGAAPSSLPAAEEIDRRLHDGRGATRGSKGLDPASPGGGRSRALVQHADGGGGAYLVWNDGLLSWSPGGYTGRLDRPKKAEVLVLTPEATVAVIRAGYVPAIHPSAVALARRTR